MKNRAAPAQWYTLDAALLAAMLIGGIIVGVALPWVSSLVDGRLYQNLDEAWGLGDDRNGLLQSVFWYVYSALYGAVLGALSVVGVRQKRAWTGLLWIATSVLFYAVMPAQRPQGESTLSGEPALLPFQVFYIAPTWLCGGVLLVGVVLSALWLARGRTTPQKG